MTVVAERRFELAVRLAVPSLPAADALTEGLEAWLETMLRQRLEGRGEGVRLLAVEARRGDEAPA